MLMLATSRMFGQQIKDIPAGSNGTRLLGTKTSCEAIMITSV
jgi:hypothetical protein